MKSNGTVFSWGNGSSGWGNLGLGNNSNALVPTQLTNSLNNNTIIVAGAYSTFVIKSDGTLWATGSDVNGQLGDGTFGQGHVFKTLIQIGNATNWKAIAPNSYHTLALKTDGTLWAWGLNTSGQVGNGSSLEQHVPVQIGTATDWKSIASADTSSIAIKNDGSLWAWGSNGGCLGNGDLSINSVSVPTIVSSWQAGTDYDWKSVCSGPSANYFLAIKNNGKLYSFGGLSSGGYGGLGHGLTDTVSSYPGQIGTDTNWQSVSVGSNSSFGIKTDGTLWAWGQNDYGQLGDGTTIDKGYPVQIGTDTDWINVTAGYRHTVAQKAGGSLWAWGRGNSGQLGNGGTASSLVPLQIPVSGCALDTEQFQDPIEKLVLSPNPASDFVNLNFNNLTGDASIELYDVMGRVVKTYPIAEVSGAINVDVSPFASGIYMVVLKENGIVSLQRKLVKN